MNREAIPLIGAISIPVIIVAVIFLYIQGYPLIEFFQQINPIYVVIIIPFVLGFIAALYLLRKMKKE